MRSRIFATEFLKYCVAGGISFVADFASLWGVHSVLFPGELWSLYLGTAIGFLVGMMVNHLFCVLFVFKTSASGNNLRKFWYSFLIGLAGLFMTEAGMFIGTYFIKMNYGLVKILVTALVFLWNYIARAVFVFSERG